MKKEDIPKPQKLGDWWIQAMIEEGQCKCEAEQIDVWKKYCEIIGKQVEFKIDTDKLEKTISKKYRHVFDEEPSACDALVDMWRDAAWKIKSGDSTFCREHAKDPHRKSQHHERRQRRKSGLTVPMLKKIRGLDDEQVCSAALIAEILECSDARIIYEGWTKSSRKTKQLVEDELIYEDPKSKQYSMLGIVAKQAVAEMLRRKAGEDPRMVKKIEIERLLGHTLE